MKVKNYYIHLVIILGLLTGWSESFAQRKSTHTRGKLWETLNNVGLIGDLGV